MESHLLEPHPLYVNLAPIYQSTYHLLSLYRGLQVSKMCLPLSESKRVTVFFKLLSLLIWKYPKTVDATAIEMSLRESKEEEEREPVVKRHHEVSGFLALLLRGYKVAEGSRAAAPTGDKVL